ncbi:MAG: STAS domain-containing protein [Gammaproteobacteria bacterium]|nr:STAS domain-containing protein [Gammaproteobacteria bacterium]
MASVTFDESVDISRVGVLYEKLKDALEGSSSIELDLGQIKNIDGAGVQLIYAFYNTAKTQNVSISFKHSSDAFVSALRIMGLENRFAPDL